MEKTIYWHMVNTKTKQTKHHFSCSFFAINYFCGFPCFIYSCSLILKYLLGRESTCVLLLHTDSCLFYSKPLQNEFKDTIFNGLITAK